MTDSRIELNGAWYLSVERAATLLKTDAQDMAARQDFQVTGRFVMFDGVRFYSELYCQQLATHTQPS